ncbi:germ cell nuclear acidic protein [Rhipicephalus microplus]|uniref:germ cell nuclear acidic protein n=1 Tax=Rhipicephalus microplus TaxID=6941 RepID=UPI003F6B143C
MACGKLSEAFERAVRLNESPLKDNANKFWTPQKSRGNRLPDRGCWSSARRRPSFLRDSSDSEDEIKTSLKRKPPASRLLTPCTAVKTPSAEDSDAWFLESLSDSTPPEKCRPDALRFRQHFPSSREELASILFSIFNREVFACKLPPGEISWNSRLISTAGRCFNLPNHKYRVELSLKILRNAEQTRDTVLHELCHAAVWCLHNCKRGGHGELWHFWVDRAARRFPKLPPAQRCHDYKHPQARKLTFNL